MTDSPNSPAEPDELRDRLHSVERELARQRHRADRLEQLALTDPLTGLGNLRAWRHALDNEESRCRRRVTPAAVICLDLDGLKGVNDRHGHHAGDVILATVGDVLRTVARAHDTVARLGGDEFAVLAVETDDAGARALAQRIAAAIARDVPLTAAFGVAARQADRPLAEAWVAADREQTAAKAARRRGRR